MQINGSTICLESDGTEIEDATVLKLLTNETLILLQPGEVWRPTGQALRQSSSDVSLADTLTLPSTSFSTSISSSEIEQVSNESVEGEEHQAPSENTWHSFTIPWNKMKMETLRDCESQNRNKRSISDVIHVTADAMRDVKSKNIPSKAIKIAANKLISKYPKVFQDLDEDGVVLGDGSHSVYAKLKEHLKYLNRPHKRTGYTRENISLGAKKKMLSAKAGCKNWQPDIMEKSVEDIKVALKKFEGKSEELLLPMLEKCYAHQRSFLNAVNSPTIQEIRHEWPILLTPLGLRWHYQKLMGHNIITLTDNMLLKAQKIVNFGNNNKFITGPMDEDDVDNTLKLIVEIFIKYFKENITYIFLQANGEEQIEICPNNAPYILQFQSDSYWVVTERQQIVNVSSFKEGLEIVFTLYYVLNLEYPKPAANSFESMQRYFLKIHPDQGTKNKKGSLSKTKIIGLLTKLRDF